MSTRSTDPELRAMDTCVKALAGLDAETTRRIVGWLFDRYPPPLSPIAAFKRAVNDDPPVSS